MISIIYKNKEFHVEDQSSMDILKNGDIGIMRGKFLYLSIEEAVYLMDIRNAECVNSRGKSLRLIDILSSNRKDQRMLSRYFTYKDWRDRGLIIQPFSRASDISESDEPISIKRYPGESLKLEVKKADCIFFPSTMFGVITDDSVGKVLYNQYWIGQYGTYKLEDHGKLNKIDIYETLFLMDKHKINVKDYTKDDIIRMGLAMRPDFYKLYLVYKDWMENSYIVKTGFKFGTNFRIYFPGAKPNNKDLSWMHSKHVLHVFPRDSKLLISEWARAIRVAHSVRKTFILAIPGKTRKKMMNIDFILYGRSRGNNTPPKYGMLSISENEYIGGSELSAIINKARSLNLELIIAIVDRETSVTYYKVRKIELPKSDYEYYEIDWMQP